MLNKITISENQDQDMKIIYKYEFKCGIDLEKGSNFCGLDVRQDLFEAILSDFKLELCSKIYGVDKTNLSEIKTKL